MFTSFIIAKQVENSLLSLSVETMLMRAARLNQNSKVGGR